MRRLGGGRLVARPRRTRGRFSGRVAPASWARRGLRCRTLEAGPSPVGCPRRVHRDRRPSAERHPCGRSSLRARTGASVGSRRVPIELRRAVIVASAHPRRNPARVSHRAGRPRSPGLWVRPQTSAALRAVPGRSARPFAAMVDESRAPLPRRLFLPSLRRRQRKSSANRHRRPSDARGTVAGMYRSSRAPATLRDGPQRRTPPGAGVAVLGASTLTIPCTRQPESARGVALKPRANFAVRATDPTRQPPRR